MTLTSPDTIRAAFCRAMSEMYRAEVPLYGALMDLVAEVNQGVLARDPALSARLEAHDNLARLSEERHGAIRLGTAEELATMRRLFAVMGMHPVGYYDLSVAGIPVHSTAFRPVVAEALRRSPFRVFTSLLRLELVEDADLRAEAEAILRCRDIFTPGVRALIDKAERDGGLEEADAYGFVAEALETFRWHRDATVSEAVYARLLDAHRLIADVVSFRGPHINHLTPRTLDIDAVQAGMADRGITPKAVIEGPPPRNCPVLLRQTSFKALNEPIAFLADDGTGRREGRHSARFGEIEQRGVALTPTGRALYDRLLDEARGLEAPRADGSNAKAYMRALAEVFAPLPDTWDQLRDAGLAYFSYFVTEAGLKAGSVAGDISALVAQGFAGFEPLVYEDFLPVSAAGIFQSNLGDAASGDRLDASSRAEFEAALGAPVVDEFALYDAMQADSIAAVLAQFAPAGADGAGAARR